MSDLETIIKKHKLRFDLPLPKFDRILACNSEPQYLTFLYQGFIYLLTQIQENTTNRDFLKNQILSKLRNVLDNDELNEIQNKTADFSSLITTLDNIIQKPKVMNLPDYPKLRDEFCRMMKNNLAKIAFQTKLSGCLVEFSEKNFNFVRFVDNIRALYGKNDEDKCLIKRLLNELLIIGIFGPKSDFARPFLKILKSCLDIKVYDRNNFPDEIKEAYNILIQFFNGAKNGKNKNLEKMILGYQELNNKNEKHNKNTQEVASEMLELLPKKVIEFPAVEDFLGKFIGGNYPCIAISSHYRFGASKEIRIAKFLLSFVHEMAHNKRAFTDLYDPRASTPPEFLEEAGSYIENKMFGLKINRAIYQEIETNNKTAEYILNLENWEPYFLANYFKTEGFSYGMMNLSESLKGDPFPICSLSSLLQKLPKQARETIGFE